MKLDTAIGTLLDDIGNSSPTLKQEYIDAKKLGYAALMAIRAWRNDNDDDLLWDLPGETNETGS